MLGGKAKVKRKKAEILGSAYKILRVTTATHKENRGKKNLAIIYIFSLIRFNGKSSFFFSEKNSIFERLISNIQNNKR